MEKKSKKSIIIGITILFLVALTLLGLTYAYYRTRIIGNDADTSVSVVSQKLEVVYSDNNATFTADEIEPGYSNENAPKTFTVENTGNGKVNYSIKLDNLDNDFNRLDWTYELLQEDTKIEEGIIPNGTKEVYIANSIEIDAGITQNYKLIIKYASSLEDQSEDMGKSLSFRINIDEEVGSLLTSAKEGTLLASIANDNDIAVPISTPGEEVSLTKYNEITGELSTTTLPADQQGYYIAYADSYKFNEWRGTFDLVNPQVGIYSEIYSNLEGKYILNLTPQSSSTSTKKVGSEEVYKVTATTSYGIFGYEKIQREEISVSEAMLAATEDDYGDSYYFRGGVENNYVNFADMCWRIVRIVGDGSVKLILEDQDNTCENADGNWNIPTTTGGTTITGNYGYTEYAIGELTASDGVTTNTAARYVMDYLHGTTNSEQSMATAFKNFQKTFTSEELTKLKSGDWCIADDGYSRSGSSGSYTYAPLTKSEMLDNIVSGTTFYYGTHTRLMNGSKNGYQPTLKCTGSVLETFEDTNNTPMYVSTLTADEIVYAGGKFLKVNRSYYLRNDYHYRNSLYWWSLSPNTDAAVMTTSPTGALAHRTVSYNDHSFRPSVSLASNVTTTTGNGTKSNPYVIG